MIWIVSGLIRRVTQPWTFAFCMGLARSKLPSSTCIIHSLRHDQCHLPGTQFLGLSKFNFWALRVLNCLKLLLVKFDFGERFWKRQSQKCLKERPACAILVAPNGTRWSRAAASPGCRRFYRKLAPTPKASEIVLQDWKLLTRKITNA